MTTLEEVFIAANKMHEDKDAPKTEEQKLEEQNLDGDGEGEGFQQLKSVSSHKQSVKSLNRLSGDTAGDGGEFDLDAAPTTENLVGNGTVMDNVKALLAKRLYIYKRDRSGLCCELFAPIILVLFGCILLQIPFLFDTPPFLLTTSPWPEQRSLFNE